MGTIPDSFSRTNNMASNKQPFLDDLNESIDSLQTAVNDNAKDFNRLALDSFPAAYAFAQASTKFLTTYNNFDKQTEVNSYTGGDITIVATGAWTDVDATNAKLTFTPDTLTGDFKVTAQFSVESVTSNATNETDVRFSITDGTTRSNATPRMKLITGVSGSNNTRGFTIEFTFDALTASAKTITLQYFITTSTATVIKVLANANDKITLEGEKV